MSKTDTVMAMEDGKRMIETGGLRFNSADDLINSLEEEIKGGDNG